MNSHKTLDNNIYEDFDSRYIFEQVSLNKKWIVLTSLIFFLVGSIYCLMSEKVWVSQVKIRGVRPDNLPLLSLMTRSELSSKYGFDEISSDIMLNDFVSFMSQKSDRIKVRKDPNKAFLIQSYSTSPSEADEFLSDFLEKQSFMYLSGLKEHTLRNFNLILSDEWIRIYTHNQIQTKRQKYIFKLYMTWLSYLDINSKFSHDTNGFLQNFNLFNDKNFSFLEQSAAEKYALFISNEYKNSEMRATKLDLLQIMQEAKKPIEGKAYQVVEHTSAQVNPTEPHVPAILILSLLSGLAAGLFGVLFYVSSVPLIRTK